MAFVVKEAFRLVGLDAEGKVSSRIYGHFYHDEDGWIFDPMMSRKRGPRRAQRYGRPTMEASMPRWAYDWVKGEGLEPAFQSGSTGQVLKINRSWRRHPQSKSTSD